MTVDGSRAADRAPRAIPVTPWKNLRMPSAQATGLRAASLLAVALIAAAAAAASPRARIEVPSVTTQNIDGAVVEVVAEGLEAPWAFEFIAADEVLINELGGRMLRVRADTAQKTELGGLPDMATGRPQLGLLDVALHPDFAENRRIYFSYTVADASGSNYALALDTARLDSDRLERRQRVLTAEPFAWSPSNFGGAIAFDEAGYLYLSVGDRSEPVVAQMGGLLQGKILRLHADGRTPADNPFVDDDSIDDRIYALGVRNPQGLDFDAARGVLFEAEHGPMGGDEINIIGAGANYGWPVISYGRNYTADQFGAPSDGPNPLLDFHLATAPPIEIGAQTRRDGMRQPLFYFLPSTAISPLAVVRGKMFPEWDGDLLVGALKGQHVSRIDFDGRAVRSEVAMLGELGGRIRDIRIAPDGSIWVLVQDGRLVRLWRDPELVDPPRQARDPGRAVYVTVCAACHEAGVGGAPRTGDTQAWRRLREKPVAQLYRNTIDGIGAMPERGACYRCPDETLRRAVDYMLEQVEPDPPTGQ